MSSAAARGTNANPGGKWTALRSHVTKLATEWDGRVQSLADRILDHACHRPWEFVSVRPDGQVEMEFELGEKDDDVEGKKLRHELVDLNDDDDAVFLALFKKHGIERSDGVWFSMLVKLPEKAKKQ